MRFSRFQVIKFTGFCTQCAFRHIVASRKHDVQVRIFLCVIFVFSVHAAVHRHLIFLSKPVAKFSCKLEAFLLCQFHRNGHVHFTGQSGVFALFSFFGHQP
ncbi:MAG: hypothetical protein DESF_01461 [Desulfovibrio sp.]